KKTPLKTCFGVVIITGFSLSTLPNTLILGIPLLKAMYGDEPAGLLAQIVVLQSLIWYNLLLFMFEFNAAKPASEITPTSEDIEDTEGQGKEEKKRQKPEQANPRLCSFSRLWKRSWWQIPTLMQLGWVSFRQAFDSVDRNRIAYVTVTTACTLQSRIALFEYSHFSQGYISQKCASLCSNPGLPHMIDLTVCACGSLFMASQRSRIACGIRMTAVAMVMKFMAGPALIAASSAALGLRADY
ncbi:hypothetical protein Gorai_005673, partial [Gossypium raimondii]|nr:hypothetical protein [Gossypium raimondii]